MTIAFFDMDETLISVNSATLWVRYQWRKGELSTTDVVRSFGYLLGYKLAIVDVERLAEDAVLRLKGRAEEDLRKETLGWYAREVQNTIIDEMRAVIEEHRTKGHSCVLLTASSTYVAEALSNDLGLDAFISTRFSVEDGVFTGRLDDGVCWGHSKAQRGRAWAEERSISLKDCWFYTDSYTDLPMLESVGNPVVVNPDPRLARWASQRKIGVLRYKRAR
jgi:HAD superfamily hydrolase (TIGR01490 family)